MTTEPCQLCGVNEGGLHLRCPTHWDGKIFFHPDGDRGPDLYLCFSCFDYIGRMWFTDPGPAYREREAESRFISLKEALEYFKSIADSQKEAIDLWHAEYTKARKEIDRLKALVAEQKEKASVEFHGVDFHGRYRAYDIDHIQCAKCEAILYVEGLGACNVEHECKPTELKFTRDVAAHENVVRRVWVSEEQFKDNCDCGADTPHWPGHPLHCRRPV